MEKKIRLLTTGEPWGVARSPYRKGLKLNSKTRRQSIPKQKKKTRRGKKE